MDIPDRVELRSLFLQALQDGDYHSHQEVADYIATELGLSDVDRQINAGDSHQTVLDNAINWIKGREFRFDFDLIEYDNRGVKFRLTSNGSKVVEKQFKERLTYPEIRRLLESD